MKHINVALFVPHYGCPHQCSFCNQNTITGVKHPLTVDDIHSAVKIALEKGTDKENSEIAFFGGSFTAIDRKYMVSLLENAYGYVKKGYFKGIRISTRPDCIDEEILDILKKYGVTSIELGAQSMNDRVLEMNERGHTSEDVVSSGNLIKQYGFELGLQMMTGLYGDTDETCIETAEKIIALKPKTVRIYPTTVLEKTKLAEYYRKGIFIPQTVESAVPLCGKLLKMFIDNGIAVIRLGLHSGGNVEDGYVAGAYHPAFRELCESQLYFEKVVDIVKKENISGNITVFVNPSEISKMTGQKRSNIEKLKNYGVNVTVKGADDIEKYDVKIRTEDAL